MSSHIFPFLQETCDFIHYLKNGKIKLSMPKGKFDLIENDMRNSFKAINFIDSIYSF